MSDGPPASEAPAGLPGWVMTFADLMTLLMCFFVLLLSFSEMDVAKFKQMAGSMEQAFGVQAEIEVKSMPKGTSIIAQEFSPGTPERTVMNTVRQFTVNSNQNSLDVGQRRGDGAADGTGRTEDEGEALAAAERLAEAERVADAERLAEEQAARLRAELAQEIADGSLLVRRESTEVVVQILEKDSFPSGSALLETDFSPTLERLGRLLGTMVGAITVSGHTDDVPISTSQFRSNWDLSAMRATTVAHQLLDAGVAPERIMVSGHADTEPRVPNDTPEHRALNRRIDITLVTSRMRHGEPLPETVAAAVPAADTATTQTAQAPPAPR